MRRKDTVVDTIKAGEGLEKQPVLKGVKLLANEEFEKECGEYADDVQEYTVSKKRKASEKLLSSKYVWHPICDNCSCCLSCSLKLFSLFQASFGGNVSESHTTS